MMTWATPPSGLATPIPVRAYSSTPSTSSSGFTYPAQPLSRTSSHSSQNPTYFPNTSQTSGSNSISPRVPPGSSTDSSTSTQQSHESSSRPKRPHRPAKYVAISTSHVIGVDDASVNRLMLARISVVDYRGHVLFDSLVKPQLPVFDYRTGTTGLQAWHFTEAPALDSIQAKLTTLLKDRIVIGHSLWHHLSLIKKCHPAIDTRDVALFTPFRRAFIGIRRPTPSSSSPPPALPNIIPLRYLVAHLMKRQLGYGYQHPVEEARAALDLYRSIEDPWEDAIDSGGWPCALPPSSFQEFFS